MGRQRTGNFRLRIFKERRFGWARTSSRPDPELAFGTTTLDGREHDRAVIAWGYNVGCVHMSHGQLDLDEDRSEQRLKLLSCPLSPCYRGSWETAP